MVEGSNVVFTKLITKCDSDSVVSIIAVEWSADIDWIHYADDQLPSVCYKF